MTGKVSNFQSVTIGTNRFLAYIIVPGQDALESKLGNCIAEAEDRFRQCLKVIYPDRRDNEACIAEVSAKGLGARFDNIVERKIPAIFVSNRDFAAFDVQRDDWCVIECTREASQQILRAALVRVFEHLITGDGRISVLAPRVVRDDPYAKKSFGAFTFETMEAPPLPQRSGPRSIFDAEWGFIEELKRLASDGNVNIDLNPPPKSLIAQALVYVVSRSHNAPISDMKSIKDRIARMKKSGSWPR